jgi:hypothetical protein
MKTYPIPLSTLLALIIVAFLGGSASAEQLIYRSIGRQVIYGNAKITRITAQGFLVVDANSLFGGPPKATAIAGFTLNGVKLYSVVPLQKYRVDTIAGPNGTYTTMAKAEAPGTQFQGVLLEAVYLRGKDQGLKIGPQAGATFPRVFSSSARAIGVNAQGGKTAGEVTGSYVFDQKATFTSNQLETFDQAVTRLSNGFAGRGYTQFSAPPAQ